MSEYRDLGVASPDVIPWGTRTDPDPAALGEGPAYAADLGVGLVPGVENFVYLRTRNPDPPERLGQLFVGRAAPTYLGWPDTLVAIPNTGGKPYYQLKVPAGQVGVSLSAFSYLPQAAGELLAGWVSTPEHRIELPELDSIVELAEFFAGTPGYVQRSVGFGLGADNQYHFLGSYDQRAVSTPLYIELQCTDCKGWSVGLIPIDGGRDISLGPLTISQDGTIIISFEATPPPDFWSTIEFAIDSRGIAPRPTSSIHCRINLLDGQRRTPLGGHLWRAQPHDRSVRSHNT